MLPMFCFLAVLCLSCHSLSHSLGPSPNPPLHWYKPPRQHPPHNPSCMSAPQPTIFACDSDQLAPNYVNKSRIQSLSSSAMLSYGDTLHFCAVPLNLLEIRRIASTTIFVTYQNKSLAPKRKILSRFTGTFISRNVIASISPERHPIPKVKNNYTLKQYWSCDYDTYGVHLPDLARRCTGISIYMDTFPHDFALFKLHGGVESKYFVGISSLDAHEIVFDGQDRIELSTTTSIRSGSKTFFLNGVNDYATKYVSRGVGQYISKTSLVTSDGLDQIAKTIFNNTNYPANTHSVDDIKQFVSCDNITCLLHNGMILGGDSGGGIALFDHPLSMIGVQSQEHVEYPLFPSTSIGFGVTNLMSLITKDTMNNIRNDSSLSKYVNLYNYAANEYRFRFILDGRLTMDLKAIMFERMEESVRNMMRVPFERYISVLRTVEAEIVDGDLICLRWKCDGEKTLILDSIQIPINAKLLIAINKQQSEMILIFEPNHYLLHTKEANDYWVVGFIADTPSLNLADSDLTLPSVNIQLAIGLNNESYFMVH